MDYFVFRVIASLVLSLITWLSLVEDEVVIVLKQDGAVKRTIKLVGEVNDGAVASAIDAHCDLLRLDLDIPGEDLVLELWGVDDERLDRVYSMLETNRVNES